VTLFQCAELSYYLVRLFCLVLFFFVCGEQSRLKRRIERPRPRTPPRDQIPGYARARIELGRAIKRTLSALDAVCGRTYAPRRA